MDTLSTKRELYKIKIACEIYRSLNYDTSSSFKRRGKYINLSVIIISSIVGTLNVSNADEKLQMVAGGLSFGVSILSILKNFFTYEEKSQIHYEIFKNLKKIIALIDVQLVSQVIDSIIYEKIILAYDDVLDKMPLFDEGFILRFKSKNKEFIEEASKNDLLPEMLTDFDNIIDGRSFMNFTNNNEYKKIENRRPSLKDYLPRLKELKKLEEEHKIKENTVNLHIKEDYGSIV